MTQSKDIKFGITQCFACSYLPEQQERLLVAVSEAYHKPLTYGLLMAQGFRRSGDQIYRPECPHCNACHSLRVLTEHFRPSQSQKRVIKKNQDLQITINQQQVADYYPLYEQYINTLHADGSMYPASYAQYMSFIQSKITPMWFIEFWLNGLLVSVAVTDVLLDGLSAVYTFYHPDHPARSLGKFAILKQLELAKQYQKAYLYLGYQIDACRKMNYKAAFMPHERFIEQQWQQIK